MLRAEDGAHLDAGGLEQAAKRRAPGGVDAGVIGDHPDPFPHQGGETGGGQDLDPRPHPVGSVTLPVARVAAGAAQGGDSGRRPHGHGRGHGRRDPGPERLDLPFAIGVQPVGENDEEGFRPRFDPQGRSGIAGVPERAGRERGVEVLAVGRADIPAQTPQRRNSREALGLGHGRHRRRH